LGRRGASWHARPVRAHRQEGRKGELAMKPPETRDLIGRLVFADRFQRVRVPLPPEIDPFPLWGSHRERGSGGKGNGGGLVLGRAGVRR
jgi:hypothetical protein